jgi:hypothetical protein
MGMNKNPLCMVRDCLLVQHSYTIKHEDVRTFSRRFFSTCMFFLSVGADIPCTDMRHHASSSNAMGSLVSSGATKLKMLGVYFFSSVFKDNEINGITATRCTEKHQLRNSLPSSPSSQHLTTSMSTATAVPSLNTRTRTSLFGSSTVARTHTGFPTLSMRLRGVCRSLVLRVSLLLILRSKILNNGHIYSC